jgi:hypothetical protein
VGGQPSRQRGIFGVVRQTFHWLDCVSKVSAPLRSVYNRHPLDVLHPGRAQNPLAGCIFDGLACQKCFCVTFDLLLTKVTKHIPPQTSPVGSSLAGI